jgi:DNA polymerase-3 subunit delta'
MWRVIGQDRAVSLLQRSLEKGALAHAYLFTGPPHIGKMTLALDLARALNCGMAEPPCGECLSCRKIEQGKHADVQVIRLSSGDNTSGVKNQTEIGIEQVRQLQHSASLPPFEGKCKVFIIDGAEFLSTEAANRLLKTLEEPESRVVFVLLASDCSFILDTVISRCQWLKLAPVAAGKVEAALISGWGIAPEKARRLARLSRGCFGWALTAAEDADFLAQHCEKRDKILDIMLAGNEERFEYAAQLAAQFSQKRDTVWEVLNLWLELWRDMLLLKLGSGEAITNIDIEDRLIECDGEYSLGGIRAFISDIQAAGERLGQNASPRLVLEVLMLDLPGRRQEKVAR